MKKIYFLLLAFILLTNTKAQIVNIPDANFKTKLLAANTSNSFAQNSAGNNIKIDANDILAGLKAKMEKTRKRNNLISDF